MPVREYSGSAKATTLSGSVTAAATVINVVDATGWPTGAVGPFVITIDAGVTTEEKVLVSGRTGNSLTVSARGFDGTTASDHGNAARVEHTLSATDIREANAHVNDTSGDPHPQYLTASEGAALYPTLTHGHAYSNLDHSHTYDSITLKPAPVQSLLATATVSNALTTPGVSVTFTGPATGRVLARASGIVETSSATSALGITLGSTVLGEFSAAGGGRWPINLAQIITVSANQSVTLALSGAAPNGGNPAWRGLIEVWSAP